nr:hypothetical protein [Tanacetum cinerariifolium]
MPSPPSPSQHHHHPPTDTIAPYCRRHPLCGTTTPTPPPQQGAFGVFVRHQGRMVIITEDTVRQALHPDDAKSIDCLPNEEIFAVLARMGYEKPSTKLTFYKAFFSAQ